MLFTTSLNQTIDLHTTRVAAYPYRAPAGLLFMLHLGAALAMMVMGYVSGLFAERSLLETSVMVVLVSIVLLLIIDLERPGAGMLQTSERALFEVQESL